MYPDTLGSGPVWPQPVSPIITEDKNIPHS